MNQFHQWMLEYCGDCGAVFPVRAVRNAERRKIYSTVDGTSIAPADNSPAWVVHAVRMERRLRSYQDFRQLMLDMPTHMFDIRKCVRESANEYGWYVAHILPAKNRNINFLHWDRREVERRFYLTLHPCNLFFVPGVRNRELGENPDVIRYIASRYATRYGVVWEQFLERVGIPTGLGDPSFDPGNFRVEYALAGPRPPLLDIHSARLSSDLVKVRYKASRLMFKRDAIEPLGADEFFEVITPMGVYRLTKGDFYTQFPSVTKTPSYRDSGLYHGAKLHLKAQRFRVGD